VRRHARAAPKRQLWSFRLDASAVFAPLLKGSGLGRTPLPRMPPRRVGLDPPHGEVRRFLRS
jgi:hypothetical protein